MESLNHLLHLSVRAAIEAGIKTLSFYNQEINVEVKSDNSPLTVADLESNLIISRYLETTGIPVLSEEGTAIGYQNRKRWKKLWIVDPLDGTKEFIKKSDEYTINIALVQNGKPVLGVVYAPAMDLLFYGEKSIGAYKVENAGKLLQKDLWNNDFRVKLPVDYSHKETIVVASKSHRNGETDDYISRLENLYGNVMLQSFGSSLKLCMVAEGRADIYPRLAPTMEWDIAAGHAIVIAAGCYISQYPDLNEVSYNKKDLLNPYFIVYNGKNINAVKA